MKNLVPTVQTQLEKMGYEGAPDYFDDEMTHDIEYISDETLVREKVRLRPDPNDNLMKRLEVRYLLEKPRMLCFRDIKLNHVSEYRVTPGRPDLVPYLKQVRNMVIKTLRFKCENAMEKSREINKFLARQTLFYAEPEMDTKTFLLNSGFRQMSESQFGRQSGPIQEVFVFNGNMSMGYKILLEGDFLGETGGPADLEHLNVLRKHLFSIISSKNRLLLSGLKDIANIVHKMERNTP